MGSAILSLVMLLVISAIFVVVGLFAWPGWLVQKETKVKKNVDNSANIDIPVVTDLSTEQKTLYEELLEDPDKLEEFIKTLVEQGDNIDTFNEQQKAIYDVLCSPGNLESLEDANQVCPHVKTFAENGVNSCAVNCLKMYKQNCQDDWCKYDLYAALIRGGATSKDPKTLQTTTSNKKFVKQYFTSPTLGTLEKVKKVSFSNDLNGVMTPKNVFDAIKEGEFDKCPKWGSVGVSGSSNDWDGSDDPGNIEWTWNHETKEEDGKCMLRASGSFKYPLRNYSGFEANHNTISGHYDCKTVDQYAVIKSKGEWTDAAPSCEGTGREGETNESLRRKLRSEAEGFWSCRLSDSARHAPECNPNHDDYDGARPGPF